MTSGYICVAVNSTDIDYVKMAYLQALSCKLTQRQNANFSLITDANTSLTEQQHQVFDNVIVKPVSYGAAADNCDVFAHSPYKCTIKTEADMLFTADYSWLWKIYAQAPVNFTQTVYTYDHKLVTDRSQRHIFDQSLLPDIYSAWTYFEYDLIAKKFFDTCQRVITDWYWYRDNYLVNCRYDGPRTDEVYAIAHQILGMRVPDSRWGFVHMKPQVQNLPSNQHWTDQLSLEIHDDYSPVIAGFRQHRPLHYQLKTFATDELIDRYEYGYRKLLG